MQKVSVLRTLDDHAALVKRLNDDYQKDPSLERLQALKNAVFAYHLYLEKEA